MVRQPKTKAASEAAWPYTALYRFIPLSITWSALYGFHYMIRSFHSKDAARLSAGEPSKRFRAIERVARRKLRQLEAALELRDLAIFPGNRLEALKGDRASQHSIRINGQWRICFVWRDGEAHNVEIVDYH